MRIQNLPVEERRRSHAIRFSMLLAMALVLPARAQQKMTPAATVPGSKLPLLTGSLSMASASGPAFTK
jgi:hypothetical protein